VLAEMTFGSKMFDGSKDFSGSRRHFSVRKEYELGIRKAQGTRFMLSLLNEIYIT
jgi:hypothetical protein